MSKKAQNYWQAKFYFFLVISLILFGGVMFFTSNKNNSFIVFIPQTALNRWWHFFLHNQTNKKIRLAIEQDPDISPDIYEVTVKTPRQQKSL